MKDNRKGLSFCLFVLSFVMLGSTFGNELKKESGWEHVQANCGGCHSLQLVTSNRGDRKIWLNLIRWMQKEHNLWQIHPEHEESILAYLSTHYSAELPMRRRPLERDRLP